MRRVPFFLFLILSLLLTGCGSQEPEPCVHQWSQADCLNPGICTLCQSVEAEPLGHAWQEPDCAAPRTCSRCGVTEGEALGHVWQEATCAAPRTCSRCGVCEGEPLPHRPGNWLLSQWDGTMYRNCLDCHEMVHSQPYDAEQYLLEYLCGIWGAGDAEGMWLLTLNPDMTFDLNGTMNGTWSYQLAYEVLGSNHTWDLQVSMYVQGQTGPALRASLCVGVGPKRQYPVMEDLLPEHHYSKYSLNLIYQGERWLQDLTGIGTRRALELMEDPDSFLTGSWNSIYTEQLDPEQINRITSDHTAEFREDGTFTVFLEETVTGTWSFRSCALGTTDMLLEFNVEPQEGDARSLFARIENGVLEIVEMGPNYLKSWRFVQPGTETYGKTDQEIVGQWNSTAMHTATHWTAGGWAQVSPTRITVERSITLHPGGTLEAEWDGPKTGRWIYTGSTFSSDVYVMEYMHFLIQFDGDDVAQSAICYSVFQSEVDGMQINLTLDDGMETWWFSRCTREEAERFAAAGETVLGSWRPAEAFTGDPETGYCNTPAPLPDCRLTFLEDGTVEFPGIMETPGTWNQAIDYIPFDGIRFEILFGGTYRSCHLTDENTLEIFLSSPEEWLRLILEKE